jgi:hypothetical protein
MSERVVLLFQVKARAVAAFGVAVTPLLWLILILSHVSLSLSRCRKRIAEPSRIQKVGPAVCDLLSLSHRREAIAQCPERLAHVL